MKITFIISENYGLAGGVRVIGIHAKKLQERGHDVVIIATPLSRQPWRERIFKWFRNSDGTLDNPSHLDNIDVPIIKLTQGKVVTSKDVPDGDVVIATLWRTAKPVMALPPEKGAKVYFVQGYEVFNSPAKENEIKKTWALPMHKITVSHWLSGLAKEQFGDFSASTVPNAVDLKLFTAPPRKKQKRPTVGMLYSIGYHKGCDIILAAFKSASQKHPELQLKAFGSYPEDLSLPLPVGTTLNVQPTQQKIAQIYASCDAWLFGSRNEGFGLPILEAMACRTPVIATPAGAAPELISGGGGIMVKSEDHEDMAEAIKRVVMMSETEWKRMSDAALGVAVKYSWDDAVILFEHALMLAVNRAKRGEIMGGSAG